MYMRSDPPARVTEFIVIGGNDGLSRTARAPRFLRTDPAQYLANDFTLLVGARDEETLARLFWYYFIHL